MISSLLTVGYIIGYLLNPLIIDKLGRKNTLLLYGIPQIISWVLIIIAKNHITIYIARILGGISYGAGICGLTIYLSEIGSSRTRGIFITFLNLSMGLGFFFAMLLGASVPYNYMNLIFLSSPIIFVITFLFVPDSPYFMAKTNREELEMKKTINPLLLREKDTEKQDSNKADYELEDHKEKEELSLEGDKKGSKFFDIKESSLWKLVTLPNNRRALVIVISLAAMDVFSGHMVMWTFTQQLLTHKGSIIDPEKATLMIAIVKIFASLLTTLIIEKMDRRVLILSSGIIGTFAQGLVGAFFFFEERNFDISSIRWWPILGMTTYELALAMGASNIFYLYQAELFSTEVKSMAIMPPTSQKNIPQGMAELDCMLAKIKIDSEEKSMEKLDRYLAERERNMRR
ncbi:facilitated trehalose transporter Tret1-like [Belonocnema kinseyi]|uniref:facilitated trehalose transporter Tret1-like n=1 Tax=Belonocnema kinseyi TaxID=2817044 RepID=UPI00143D56FF|nr:facilitated trehalose transporter Tret1-like [Belonocnema kinseyi]